MTGRQRALRVVQGVLCLYLAVCAVFFLDQKILIYQPSRPAGDRPDRFGLRFDTVWLPVDGGRIESWVVRAGAAAPWVLFCHGNGGNMSYNISTLQFYHRLGCNVVMCDYCGYGDSDGRPSEQGLYDCGEAVWNWLTVTTGVPASRIVVVGESLGTGVACEVAERNRPAGLILVSPFTCIADVGQSRFPFLPCALLVTQRFPNLDRIGHMHCPKLIAHCPQDTIVPFALGRKLFDQAPPPKQFYPIRTILHGAPTSGEPEFDTTVQSFIATCVPASAAPPPPLKNPGGPPSLPIQGTIVR